MIYKRLINLYNYDIILFHLKQLICIMEHMIYCVQYHNDIPYTTKFSLDKNSPSPATFVLQKCSVEYIFANAVKVAISSINVSINTGQKICTIKISLMRVDGEIGENFCVYIYMVL